MSQTQQQTAPLLPYHPSGDQRFASLDQTIEHYHREPTALIQILHAAQHTFGYLAPDVLRYIAGALKLPLAQVYGVATFYNFFSVVPRGKYQIMVCRGNHLPCPRRAADDRNPGPTTRRRGRRDHQRWTVQPAHRALHRRVRLGSGDYRRRRRVWKD